MKTAELVIVQLIVAAMSWWLINTLDSLKSRIAKLEAAAKSADTPQEKQP